MKTSFIGIALVLLCVGCRSASNGHARCPSGHALMDVPMLPGPPTVEMIAQERRGEGIVQGDCVGKPSIAHVCVSCRKWKTDEMSHWQPLSPRFGTERNPSPSASANLLDGLIVTGVMKQIIGSFSTYGIVRIGDSFELNLTNLPKDRIYFTRPNYDPQKATRPYVPFSAPLIVEKVEQGRKESVGSMIRLSSIATDGTRAKLIIQMWTPELRKGNRVRIKIYEEVFGDIGCMAEAEGVFK